jgi:hypothetical protein
MAVDMDKLQEFLGRFVTDLGATFAAGSVVTGHRLGLYRALAEGPVSAAELAERTRTSPRYITEWLRGQAAGGYVAFDPVTETYSMTEEQASSTRPVPSAQSASTQAPRLIRRGASLTELVCWQLHSNTSDRIASRTCTMSR